MKSLNATSQGQIDNKYANQTVTIKIGGVAVDSEHIRDFQWEQSIWTNSSARVTLSNPEAGSSIGAYSPGGDSEVSRGDVLQIIEGVGSDTFNKFYGLVQQATPIADGGDNYIEIEALGLLTKLKNTDYEGTQEARIVLAGYRPCQGSVQDLHPGQDKLSHLILDQAIDLVLEFLDGLYSQQLEGRPVGVESSQLGVEGDDALLHIVDHYAPY